MGSGNSKEKIQKKTTKQFVGIFYKTRNFVTIPWIKNLWEI
jgi:hypothetical protein